MLDPSHLSVVVPGGNGMFRATVVRGRRVVGTWTRTRRAKWTVVRVEPLVALDAAERDRVEEAFGPYGRFVGERLRLEWDSPSRV